MTFGLYSHDPVLGIDHVGCGAPGLPGGASCDPYKGDTLCKTKLAVLCTDIDGSLRPGYAVSAGNEFYEGWTEGHYTTTSAGGILSRHMTSCADRMMWSRRR